MASKCCWHFLVVELLISTSVLIIVGTPMVYGLDNGLAQTPPMGWIAWERFTCTIDCDKYPNDCVNERLFQQMADRMEADGWLSAGYEFINIDDCWSSSQRDAHTHKLVADSKRFPDGISLLANYIHAKGLKFGMYGDCGTLTCAGYPAQLKSEQNLQDNYMKLDASLFAEWQVDSFKFDSCYLDPAKAESICPQMAAAINQTQRPMVLICEWPFYMMREPFHLRPNYGLVSEACNAWRYFEDVEDSWLSVLNIIDFTIEHQSILVQYHGPGHWFDPDQLIIGNFALSLEQARAQMAIWCLWSAPLYMGNDLRHIDPDMAKVLQNDKLIAVDQDLLGVMGQMVALSSNSNNHDKQLQAFVKPVEPIKNGCPSFVIIYLNRATLGGAKLMTFQVRNLLSKAPLSLAAKRYATVYSTSSRLPGGLFDGEECQRLINVGMSRDPRDTSMLIRPRNSDPAARVGLPIEEQEVVYKVYDLFNDPMERKWVQLNGNLTLQVNPSGVRVVKLVSE